MSVVDGGADLSSTLGEIVQYGNLTGYLSFVVPPGMFHHQTTRRMRLCLSIPHPFDVPSTRVFIPTAATVDIRPVQLMFVGRFGATSAGGNTKTLLSFPEYSDNIILPLYGYGILPDMQLFLSQETCVSQTTLQEAGYVNRISLLNITIAAPYDIPLSFRHRGSLVTSDSTVYLVLTSAEHTNRALANKVFGTTRQPLNLCLYAPQTDNLVYPTPFTFVVSRRAVTRVQNPTLPATNSTSAVVGYGTSLDLLVTGVGLDGNRSVMIPALNCSNASTYLWREAVALSAVPTAVTLAYLSSSSRFYDYGSDNGSWYLPLTELQTSRVGSKTKTANGTTSISSSFMWCINYDRYSPAEYSFEATGIPYTLAIPNVTGFSSSTTSSASVTTTTSTTLAVYQESALLGEWTKVTLKGPLVDLTGTKAMYVFLSEPLISCARPPASLVASNATDRFIVVVNATALLLPRHLGTVGTYKLCATVLYPVESDLRAGAAAIAGNESRLQFIEIPTLRINVLANTYKLFTINSTLSPTVEQGDSPMLTVDGVGLSHWSRLRLLSAAAVQAGTAVCGDSTPMPGGVIDIVVRSTYSSYQNLGTNGNANFYIQLDHEETLALPIDTYVVCFHPTPVDKWVQTSIRLSVVEHHRRQSLYNYFVDEDAYDVTVLNTFAPTKLYLPATATTTNTSLVNVVGTIGREVSLQLLCRNASTSTGFMSCGDNKRVMLARPMEDGSSPCFVDDEAEDWENIRGPYLLLHSVLTIPTQIMTEYSYVPGFADPWVLCVEVAPEEWRRPMLPEVVLQYTTEEVTGQSAP
ncbi:Hypothetical protein, putative [Bodo saltans]|uniref:Uncharacterized protein n=1 Tax=Bodo saltans TaxID=75058 RepID=A0A0S4JCS6_BODSA|nr:Hypothetical protein, putative [Bodo saltans]|eukprot:CUG87812.1 Hypothetical protein, putative [Bodo saltans]